MALMRYVLREPLFHFALLALLIFGAHSLLAPGSNQPKDNVIVVTAPKIEQIVSVFARTWQRPPSAGELKGLIDDYVDEEISVREAIALGLDQDDTVIRRRLRQKMGFLQDTEVDALSPTEAELAAFLAANSDRFAVEPRVGFDQIFLSPDRRGDAVTGDARAILASLSDRPDLDPATIGDPSLLPGTMGLTALSEIGRMFGSDFADVVGRAPAGAWTGPVASAYGVHLIRVTEFEPGREPPLAEVRAAVLREWTNAKAAEMAAARLGALRERYQITIELPAATGAAP